METFLIRKEHDVVCFPKRHRLKPRAFTEEPGDTFLSTQRIQEKWLANLLKRLSTGFTLRAFTANPSKKVFNSIFP